MKIVADVNIPFVKRAFADFGTVHTVDGRSLDRVAVTDAEILLVRSVTKVDEALLAGSKVRFVATATIGMDHVDLGYLSRSGIGFAGAPGSNANSVAEYVLSALLCCSRRTGRQLSDLTLGIVGVGCVGSHVQRLAAILGMRCLLNDPPRARFTGDTEFVPLDELLAKSDVVTLHVPLTAGAVDPTVHMVNEHFIGAMKQGAWFLNTSRGGVVDETALRSLRHRLEMVVLDVWENEPAISLETLEIADIATPHIAGYSFDGKVGGTRMIHDAACAFFGRPGSPVLDDVLQLPATFLDLASAPDAIHAAVVGAYPILVDDRRLRAIVGCEPSARGAHFDHLRHTYPRRLEFRHFLVPSSASEAGTLSRLGFEVI